MADSQGITTTNIVVEYSDEVPPVAAATWNEVLEGTDVSADSNEAADIDFTHFGSTRIETRRGLPGGINRFTFTHILRPTDAIHAGVINKTGPSGKRWWRITYEKFNAASASGAIEKWAGTLVRSNINPGSANSRVDLEYVVGVDSDYTYTAEA